MPTWGRSTVLRFYGGQLHLRLTGPTTPDDWFLAVGRMLGRSTNLTAVFNAIKPGWIAQTRSVFQQQGPGWAPLAPSTLLRRRFPGRPILQQTGRLMRSLSGGPGMVWKAGPRSLQYGSTVPYYVFHQRGTKRMPRRQMIVLRDQLKADIRRRLARYVLFGEA